MHIEEGTDDSLIMLIVDVYIFIIIKPLNPLIGYEAQVHQPCCIVTYHINRLILCE